MKIRVAVTSSDGTTIDLHFGRCSDFLIAEIDGDSGEWRVLGRRKAEQTCHNFSHQEEHVREVAKLLSDCPYLFTYRIGIYPYSVFRERGVRCFETPTEEPQPIDATFRSFRKYLETHPFSSGRGSGPAAGTEQTGRKGI